jgi:hypothetical protein
LAHCCFGQLRDLSLALLQELSTQEDFGAASYIARPKRSGIASFLSYKLLFFILRCFLFSPFSGNCTEARVKSFSIGEERKTYGICVHSQRLGFGCNKTRISWASQWRCLPIMRFVRKKACSAEQAFRIRATGLNHQHAET